VVWRAVRDIWWRLRAGFPVGLVGKRRVSAVWGGDAHERKGRIPRDWLDHMDVLRGYVFPQFGGVDWYQHVRERYCPEPRELGLSLCCGDGHVERDFVRYGLCKAAEGVEVAPEAVEVCRREAEAAGLSDRLRYWAGDVERAHLPRGKYNVVVAWMGLHHLRRLDHVFEEVRRALKPGGILIANEYVGPARFQVPRERVDAINTLLAELPEEVRRLESGDVKERFDAPSLAEVVRHDPSEAVRSDRILPTMRRWLTVVECIEYGGSILYWLLQGIVHNFDAENSEHRALLNHLYGVEREGIEGGRWPSDFAFVVAQRPEEVRG